MLKLILTSVIMVLLASIVFTACATIDCTPDDYQMVKGVDGSGPYVLYSVKKGNCK